MCFTGSTFCLVLCLIFYRCTIKYERKLCKGTLEASSVMMVPLGMSCGRGEWLTTSARQHRKKLGRQVIHPNSADNVLSPLPNRLSGVHQPVVSMSNGASRLPPALLAW